MSVATNFDPYKTWLGIPAGVRPPNHYQLLGLELFESEPPVIAEAAEERDEKIRAVADGPQAAEGQKLLAEIAAARKVLLSAATRRAYDAELRQKMGMPPAPQPKGPPAPVGRTAPAAAPVAAVPVAAQPVAAKPVAARAAAQPAVPMAAVPVAAAPMAAVPAAVPMAAVPMAAVPMAVTPMAATPMAAVPMAPGFAQAVPVAGMPQAAAAIHDLGLHDDSSESSYRPRYRRQSSAGSWAVLGIGFLLLAGLGVAGFLFKDQLLAALDDQPQTVEVVSGNTVAVKPHTPPPESTNQGMNPITAAARAGGSQAASQPGSRDMASIDLSQPGLVNQPLPETKAMGVISRPSTPRMDGNPNAGRMKPPQVVSKVPPKPVEPLVMIPSLNKPATVDEKVAVAKSLAAVRKALGERNTTKAAEQLNLATLEAASPESLAAIDRMKTLESALDAFWKAVDEGIKGLKPIDELTYDGMTGVVINAEPGSLSLRIEGQSKEYTVNKLPTGLAYHLAERWLREGDPQTKLILGSFLYVEPKGDQQKARQLWEEAANQGADVAKLLVQLDTDLAAEASK